MFYVIGAQGGSRNGVQYLGRTYRMNTFDVNEALPFASISDALKAMQLRGEKHPGQTSVRFDSWTYAIYKVTQPEAIQPPVVIEEVVF